MDKVKSFLFLSIGAVLGIALHLLNAYYPELLKSVFKFMMSFSFVCFISIPVLIIIAFILGLIASFLKQI